MKKGFINKRFLFVNFLSISRILPLFLFLYFFKCKNLYGSLISWTCLGFSDTFDGYLARKWNVQSEIGALIDHGIDKIIELSVAYHFYIQKIFHPVVFYIITFKNIFLIIGGSIIFINFKWALHSNSLGKIGGFLMYISVFLILLKLIQPGLLLLYGGLSIVIAGNIENIIYTTSKILKTRG